MSAQARKTRVAPASSAAKCVGTSSDQFQQDLIALIPHLRAFSRSLCGRRAIADDMAQEALARAWRSRDSFEAGSNMKAWLFTILRNEFYSHMRRAWRQTAWDPEKGDNIAAPSNEQDWSVELSDTARGLQALPVAQREALILVGVGGFSYEDAGKIAGAPNGTMKSRVARARASLLNILDGDEPLPNSSRLEATSASEDIFNQLSALVPKTVNRAAHV